MRIGRRSPLVHLRLRRICAVIRCLTIHQPLTMLDHRCSRSTDEVTSTRVEMVHTCPAGSIIRPVRSPQNWFFTGSRILAPAATAS
jgi:hypothetical protein